MMTMKKLFIKLVLFFLFIIFSFNQLELYHEFVHQKIYALYNISSKIDNRFYVLYTIPDKPYYDFCSLQENYQTCFQIEHLHILNEMIAYNLKPLQFFLILCCILLFINSPFFNEN